MPHILYIYDVHLCVKLKITFEEIIVKQQRMVDWVWFAENGICTRNIILNIDVYREDRSYRAERMERNLITL